MKTERRYTIRFLPLLSFVSIMSFLSLHPLMANETTARLEHYHALLSTAPDPLPVIVELVSGILSSADSSYTLQTDPVPTVPLLVSCGSIRGEELPLMIAVDLNHAEDALWSLSGWLVMIEGFIQATDSCSAAFSIIPSSGMEKNAGLEAGETFWSSSDPYQYLATLEPDSVVLLDVGPGARKLNLQAEARGRLTPLHVLQSVRSSLHGLGIEYGENAVTALYSRAGLYDGSVGLSPWLELGVPAIRLYGSLEDHVRFLPAMMLQHQEKLGIDWSVDRDVNYFRYQIPAAVLSFDDSIVTRAILVLLGIFLVGVALRPLFMHRLPGSLGPGVLPEALVAYLFSFIAVYLSWLIHGFAGRLFGSGLLNIDLPPLILMIGVLGRLGSTLFFFFALSGLSARSCLLPHAVRGTASQASALLAGILGMAILYFSIQGSLLLFGTMTLLSLAGINAAVAVLSISALAVLLIPFVIGAVPVVVPGLVTILNAQGTQLLLLAGFTAPGALWILTTLSPRHRLVRGSRTAPYLVAAALVLCFLDPWLRARP